MKLRAEKKGLILALTIMMANVLVVGAANALVLDFTDFSAGSIMSNQYDGVTISGNGNSSGAPDVAVVFDTGSPTGGDNDLAGPFSTSNPSLSNEYDPGNVLILQENAPCGDVSCDEPDDDANGGRFSFQFDAPVTINSIDFFDIEERESGGEVQAFSMAFVALDADGDPLDMWTVPTTGGDNTWDRLILEGAEGVGRLDIILWGSGAIDNIDFTTTAIPVPASVWLFGSALGLLAGVRRRLATV